MLFSRISADLSTGTNMHAVTYSTILSFFLTFLNLQADQRVLKDLMWEKLPRLMAHLKAQKVDVSLVTVEWFLVLFVDSLPSRILFKVWDAFLYEGIKVPCIPQTIERKVIQIITDGSCVQVTFPLFQQTIQKPKYKWTDLPISQVIFRYALALFRYREENILKIHDSAEMYQYLRLFSNTIADGR